MAKTPKPLRRLRARLGASIVRSLLLGWAATGSRTRSARPRSVRKCLLTKVPYFVAADDLELLKQAISRFRTSLTIAEFERARVYSTGVNFRLLRARPDLDRELAQAYEDACGRFGLDPQEG